MDNKNNKDIIAIVKQMVVDGVITQKDAEKYCPELAESEDERIRKYIIKYFEASKDELSEGFKWNGITVEECIAWLEKQKFVKCVKNNALSELLDEVICHFINNPDIPHEERKEVSEKIIPYVEMLENQGDKDSLNINHQECLKGIKRVQEYQDLSDWEKKFDNIASMYAHNKNQEGYNNSWYVKERAAAMLYHAKKELEKQSEPIDKIVKKAMTEKQRVLLTETNGDANIDWDTRSLQDVKLLLEYGLNYIKKLEKQGEQKSAVFIPKFRVGDIVKSKSQSMLRPRKITSIGKDCYWCEDRGCIGFAWEDDYEFVEQNPAWSEEDENKMDNLIQHLKVAYSRCDWLDETINWLKDLKNRVLPQPKPKQEWSDYDECMLANLIDDPHCSIDSEYVHWFKSIKDRYTWKPSDEQMSALNEVINYAATQPVMHWNDYLYTMLKSLREQLKAL